MRNTYDWSEPVLRQSAVDYALRHHGPVPPQPSPEWEAGMQRCAAALGVPKWRDLVSWLKEGSGSPSRPEGMDEESIVSQAAAESSLEALLAREDGTLDHDARMRLAENVECGRTLRYDERQTLVQLLRGSAFATRADVFRSLVVFLTDNPCRTVWQRRSSSVRVPEGGSWRYADCPVRVRMGKVFATMGQSMIVIMDAKEQVTGVRIFARARRFRDGILSYRQLVPAKRFSSDLIARKLAILSSFIAPQGEDGKRLSGITGDSKALVSYHRKTLARQLQESNGSRVGFAGLRNTPQRNKGVAV